MTTKLMGVLILAACILALALPAQASTDAAVATSAPAAAEAGASAPVTTTTPVELPASLTAPGECDGSATISSDPNESALLTPAPTPVCEFCNLTGFVNCESTDGTACSVPGTHKRCYINPPCACEWGICRCLSSGTWSCIW